MYKCLKKILCSILLVITIILTLTACGTTNKKYSCKYCGTKMEAYYSYHNGYVCWACNKKYHQ